MASVEEVNQLALMAAAGIVGEEAAEKLQTRVAITTSDAPGCIRLAKYTRELLERTLKVVDGESADIDVIIGTSGGTSAPVAIGVTLKHDTVSFGLPSDVTDPDPGEPESPNLLLKIAACYLAGYVVTKTISSARFEGIPIPFVVSADVLGLNSADLNRKIVFDGESVLVGAGGVANGFLWALEDMEVCGRLHIVDPKVVAQSNLNRCLYFTESDIGSSKVLVLAAKALQGKVDLVPHQGDFKALVHELGKVRRAYTTVDSRRVRRAIRGELPLEILDASTTDISEVVVFSERQPTSSACLSCIYAHIPVENEREKEIASALGLELQEVRQQFVDELLAKKLAALHPTLDVQKIQGMALDSLFREMCGAGTLLTAAGQQALAPLGFISNLAGCLLALELFKFDRAVEHNPRYNYMALDPWRPPHRRARIHKAAKPDCAFCSKEFFKKGLRDLWGEPLP